MRISDWSSDVCSSDLISLPGLKYGTRLASTSTVSPVRGLRPVRASRARVEKAPNPRSSTRPSSASRAVISSKKVETIASTSRSRSEEHTSELQSLMRLSYAVFCMQKQKQNSSRNIYLFDRLLHRNANHYAS